MIRKLLIANRGEIACRIIRTCQRLGIFSVAVYSDADAHALHVVQADEAVYLGGAPAAHSYLNIDAILHAARISGADAVHPGFGFLAEKADFARAVMAAGLIWIGPPPAAMEALGNKSQAKRRLSGIPLVPGYSGDDQSDAALIAAAAASGWPVMVKAAAGGGGKGMRRVDTPDDLPEALAAARREAAQAFGDATLLVERFILHPRHVEIQIFGDQHGRVVALGERECSIQRRHQKIIEESPSTALDADLRARMCAAAVSIGEQVGYVSAGTVEFILDRDRQFYFLEVNTRLQVEHPVTELRAGIDLVEWQLRAAEGASIAAIFGSDADPLTRLTGHAIEARVYAEDPAASFLPSIGPILCWEAPAVDGRTVRVDGGVRTGDAVTVHYDPMIAKISAWGETRDHALARLDRALGTTTLLGIRHNIPYLRRVLLHPDHVRGEIATDFVDSHPDLLTGDETPPVHALVAAALSQPADAPLPPGLPGTAWRSNPYRPTRHTFAVGSIEHEIAFSASGNGQYAVTIDGGAHTVWASDQGAGRWDITVDGHRLPVTSARDGDRVWIGIDGASYCLTYVTPLPVGAPQREAAGTLRSPMPGQVIRVDVAVGQTVAAGETLLIIEAMKMEHRIRAPYAGIVSALYFQPGQSVGAGVILLDLQASTA